MKRCGDLVGIICGLPLCAPIAHALPAFPGAEGFGANAVGGRGGVVVKVTRLDDYRPGPGPTQETPIPGTFRYACEQVAGPRIVVFDVSGNIELKCNIKLTEPYITIAGQSAPGGGVCLKNAGIKILTDEVVIRHLRIRPGAESGACGSCYSEDSWDPLDPPYPSCPCTSPFAGCCDYAFGCCDCPGDNYRDDHHHPAPDGMSIEKGQGIMIDHCSVTWSVDECLSAAFQQRDVVDEQLRDVTVQWCVIAEPLNEAYARYGDDKEHAYGSLIRTHSGGGLTFHHNLYAHMVWRAPRPTATVDKPNAGMLLDFRNNVLYNCGETRPGGNNTSKNAVVKMNYVGNYLEPGPFAATGFGYIGDFPIWEWNGTSWWSNPSRYTTWCGYLEFDRDAQSHFADNWFKGGYPANPYGIIRFRIPTPTEDADGQYFPTVAYITDVYAQPEFAVAPVATDDALTAYTRVLASVGATAPKRDSVDARIVSDVRTGGPIVGDGIIDRVYEVGGWPDLGDKVRPPTWDTDNDGMQDAWEVANGLIVGTNDSAGDRDGNGYTNIEDYLNMMTHYAPIVIPADFDKDHDVDLADYVLFMLCFSGAHTPPPESCMVDADFDNDTEVDVSDFA